MTRGEDDDKVIDGAIEEAESHRATLSITFLLTCLYLGLTAIAANDQQLLLDDNLTLQPFSIPVGLSSFFFVAPAFILILHSYILIHQNAFLELLGRSKSREGELDEEEAFLRFPTPPAFRLSSTSSGIWLLSVKVGLFVVYAILPLSVLCIIQYKYLPYHSLLMTGWHQALIVVDLVMMGYLLLDHPKYWVQRRHLITRRKKGYKPFPSAAWTRAILTLVGLFSLAVMLGALLGRFSDEPPAGFLKRHLALQDKFLMNEVPPDELVAAAVPDGVTRDLEASKVFAYLRFGEGASLRGRDLRGADFGGAKLLKADLGGADLQGARLRGANLRGANLSPVDVDESILELPRGPRKVEEIGRIVNQLPVQPGLVEADLRNSDFRGARLILANLTGADLRGANLTGVELTGADLRGAFLQGAHLEGAELSYAKLDGAYLAGAHLEGVTFDHASLVNASLVNATAVGASFVEADLDGARLAEARLQAANFRGATLAGSDLRGASLQGASFLKFEALDARGAHLGGACPVTPLRLVDLRDIDFKPFRSWIRLRLLIEKRLHESPEASRVALARIDDAMKRSVSVEAQAACLGTNVQMNAPLQWRMLLYFDEQRTDVMQSWPPAAEQSQDSWSEAVFQRELASELAQRACSKSGLADALALRAASEAGPGDLALDIEVARQVYSRFQPGADCPAVEELPRSLKRQIEHRLHEADREAGQD